ncbi:GCN5-like N-acetyltransferase [Niallia circulans]|jgi:[ribosomal protein S5]-alanine N-acetyltransferase|uniref:GCN5 family acetyltransferase n=1 Tax=Niallia circulans TaxID=1397 RepID=A0A0J1IPZ1_NIACI|nr:GNAT family N-acetyltransferase [Niallia circulans]KLV28026.1 GCN5 family acetyltransferase [Niallia circulans]MDR4314849.1 GNAT family N-acetyltransferase [Niallia circulans]MED3837837.1 GNAT family N-acetyltransferase [Niallia circulans]MED4243016.1 GNAT family N-acetyltransferase [Niallia circulans]MED4246995.1 GNAT family N-acetyltransferase [Niallia circulans]
MDVFETKRLLLRGWKEADYKDLYEYAQKEEVGPFAGWPPHKSEQESKEVIRYFLQNENSYAIVWKEENKVIGSIGFHERTPDTKLSHLAQREVGFALNPRYWGRGIVPEAVNYLLEYGFEHLCLDLIWCGHFDFNTKSRRVNEKCGFHYKFQKTNRYKLFDNQLITSVYYCMTKEEYFKKLQEPSASVSHTNQVSST